MHTLNGIPQPAMDKAYQTREQDRITGMHGSAFTDIGFPGIPARFAKTFSNHLAKNLHLNLVHDLCQCSHCEVDVLNQEPAHSESAANMYTMRLHPWLRQAHLRGTLGLRFHLSEHLLTVFSYLCSWVHS